jgi:hypothetical protein
MLTFTEERRFTWEKRGMRQQREKLEVSVSASEHDGDGLSRVQRSDKLAWDNSQVF